MSFPPFREPKDYETYKNIYLQSLQQQINNNNRNYNANIVYQNTGEFTSISTETASVKSVQKIPSVPPDMRNLDEKMNDINGLRVIMRKYLLEITDDYNASLIMSDLEDDPELLRYAVNSFPRIKIEILKSYSVGISYLDYMSLLNLFMNQNQGLMYEGNEINYERKQEIANVKQLKRLAEEARLEEEEEKRQKVEEKRLAKEKRLAEKKRIEEESRIATEFWIAEEAKFAEEERLREEEEEERLALKSTNPQNLNKKRKND